MANHLQAKAYSPRTGENYVKEMRYIFAHYNHLSPTELTQNHIIEYLIFIKKEHGVGRDKCRMAASACSYFFKNIAPTPYITPNSFYPKKEFRLPDILSTEQITHVLSSIQNKKHKAIIALFYGTGIRLSELRFLKPSALNRKNASIKIIAGKGNKDRFTILPKSILPLLENYWRAYKPSIYLFEGQKKGIPLNDRSIQHAIRKCMHDAGLAEFNFSSHSLRHSFATHMLDAGSDIHTIKELLGHSKIETTMIYLHLTKKKRENLVSPLDLIAHENE